MPNTPLKFMTVGKYIPDQMYGFLHFEGLEVFFHLRVFRPETGWVKSPRCIQCKHGICPWADSPPPPILGEMVEVEIDTDSEKLRAKKVLRKTAPLAVHGIVDTFDATRGYGFVKDLQGNSYHLHRSEVTEGRIPLAGQDIMFYAGIRQDKPRACYVKICK